MLNPSHVSKFLALSTTFLLSGHAHALRAQATPAQKQPTLPLQPQKSGAPN